jgi:hypothetical protein
MAGAVDGNAVGVNDSAAGKGRAGDGRAEGIELGDTGCGVADPDVAGGGGKRAFEARRGAASKFVKCTEGENLAK